MSQVAEQDLSSFRLGKAEEPSHVTQSLGPVPLQVRQVLSQALHREELNSKYPVMQLASHLTSGNASSIYLLEPLHALQFRLPDPVHPLHNPSQAK